jgi:hypothetical protein
VALKTRVATASAPTSGSKAAPAGNKAHIGCRHMSTNLDQVTKHITAVATLHKKAQSCRSSVGYIRRLDYIVTPTWHMRATPTRNGAQGATVALDPVWLNMKCQVPNAMNEAAMVKHSVLASLTRPANTKPGHWTFAHTTATDRAS